MPELSVVIPTYNEKDNIGLLIAKIAEALQGIDYEIVVVDDRSPDGTGEVVEKLARTGQPVRLITKPQKEGIGAALRLGYKSCTTPIIASTDADLSFDPQDLHRLYEAVRAGQDLVTGTRHSKNSFYETPNRAIWTKHLVSLVGNRTLRTLTGIPLDDFTANFRAFTKTVWDAIETEENTNSLLFEMILKAYVKGYSVAQIPVAFHDRRFGSSKLRLSLEAPKFFVKLVKYLWRYHRVLLRRRLKR
ncbi:MAG: glycosyltransferase [Candidatus Andersenbacteria bacterium]